MTDRLISRQEAIRLMGISDTTERRLRKRGEMPPHIAIGHKILYRLSTIQQWLTDREVTGS